MIDIVAVFKTFITNNFTHANVTGIDEIPEVKTEDDFNRGRVDITDGLIKILYDDYEPDRTATTYYDETYTLECEVTIQKPVNRTALVGIIIELDRIFRANNNTQPDEEYYMDRVHNDNQYGFSDFTLRIERRVRT
jgi:hypothetical protein